MSDVVRAQALCAQQQTLSCCAPITEVVVALRRLRIIDDNNLKHPRYLSGPSSCTSSLPR
jgi:hypothetical protein